jgi:uncharacterized membrane protein
VLRWTAPTGWIELPPPAGWPAWAAKAVSADGAVIVGYFLQPGSNTDPGEGARWTEADGVVPQGFPGGGGGPYDTWSVFEAVSVNGQTAVGHAGGYSAQLCQLYWPDLHVTAFRQNQPGGPLHKLDDLSGHSGGRARAISSDGSTIVGESFQIACFTEYEHQACFWTAGGWPATPMGFVPGLPESFATGVSANGEVMIGFGWNAQVFGQRAFRWTTPTGMESLELLPGTIASEPKDLSADGSVIVGGCTFVVASVMHGRACIWDEPHGARALSDAISGLGVGIGDWTLTHAVGISSDGRTVAGNGINPAGEPEAWIAFLGDAVCYPDCNADGAPTVADFGCFQTKFVAGDPYADCTVDGGLTVADFGCFQTKFAAGCP